MFGFEICPDCFYSIFPLDQSRFCENCGQERHKGIRCSIDEIFYDRIHSWGHYSGGLKSMVQTLKFRQGIGLVRYFLPSIVEFIHEFYPDIDALVPVPLGKSREHQRGYNQTALFARPAARQLGLRYLPQSVERTRETISQVGLNADERRVNIQNAFQAKSAMVEEINILLLDDITTTGSTINECAKAIKQAGAKSVSCFTLAKAGKI